MTIYSRENPYFAPIKERYNLCEPHTGKSTLHIVLDIAGSGIEYNVGDSVAVYPTNDPANIQTLLNLLKATGDEVITDKRTKTTGSLWEYLAKKSDLNKVSRKLLQALHDRQMDPQEKEQLNSLLADDAADVLKIFLTSHTVGEVMEIYLEPSFTPQELCDLLMPLMPRFYSIASSRHAVGDEIHLTVTLQQWLVDGKVRTGVCTHYLCNLAPLMQREVPIYIHPHKGFTLPKDPHAPIIMIGPGTGIAPFRAFLQERAALRCPGRNWLFFGEWNQDHHYYYQEEWDRLEAEDKLRVDLAFSRDQAQKIYVQHRMLENGPELVRWIREGAYIYVCGDAGRMAKDVEAALLEILQHHGDMTEEAARRCIRELRKEQRYLKDVY